MTRMLVAAAVLSLAAVPLAACSSTARTEVETTTTGQQLIDLKDVTIPVRIQGPFDKPSYTLLWKDAVGAILKRSLENKLRDAVSGKGKNGESIDKALKGLLGK